MRQLRERIDFCYVGTPQGSSTVLFFLFWHGTKSDYFKSNAAAPNRKLRSYVGTVAVGDGRLLSCLARVAVPNRMYQVVAQK